MASTPTRWSRSLQRAVELTGVGLHSGKPVRIRVSPPTDRDHQNGHGILFHREGREPIRASVASLDPTKSVLCTQLRSSDDSWRVSTVEHLMAALVAARVTHADVHVVDFTDRVVEMPILDGSALPFVHALQDAGLEAAKHDTREHFLRIERPVQVMLQDKAAWFLPIPSDLSASDTPVLHMSVQVNFAHRGLGSRFFQLSLVGDADGSLQAFARDVAPARTFTFEDEIAWMQANNLALGGSLENAVVFQQPLEDQWRVLNSDGLRFSDEWVRHKMLDCVGDLGLVGMPVHGFFFATSPGHALTHRLIQVLFADPSNYTIHAL